MKAVLTAGSVLVWVGPVVLPPKWPTGWCQHSYVRAHKTCERINIKCLQTKARSTLATMSKQRSTFRKDEISTQNSFDIVAVFGNKVERCFDIVAKKGNNVEATFDIVAFDNVASTLLLVWTGLNTCSCAVLVWLETFFKQCILPTSTSVAC